MSEAVKMLGVIHALRATLPDADKRTNDELVHVYNSSLYILSRVLLGLGPEAPNRITAEMDWEGEEHAFTIDVSYIDGESAVQAMERLTAEVDRLTALLPSSDPNPRYLGQIARLTAESKITCADCLHMGPYGCTNLDKSAAYRCKHGPPPSDKTPLPYARMDCAGFQEKP